MAMKTSRSATVGKPRYTASISFYRDASLENLALCWVFLCCIQHFVKFYLARLASERTDIRLQVSFHFYRTIASVSIKIKIIWTQTRLYV